MSVIRATWLNTNSGTSNGTTGGRVRVVATAELTSVVRASAPLLKSNRASHSQFPGHQFTGMELDRSSPLQVNVPMSEKTRLGGSVPKPKTLDLSIYLIKNRSLTDTEIIKTDKADDPIEIRVGEDRANLYVKKEVVRSPPDWTRFFTTHPEVPADIFGRPNSIGAVLVYRKSEATFILSFGTGHHLVNDGAVERDFGLRVTLNSVNPDELRSLDKATYTHNPLNSRTQSPKGVDIFDLDVDGESEMLYAITGVSKDASLGVRVTGRDALSIAVPIELNDLPRLLSHISSRYEAPLPAEFDWVDNVSRVRDPDDIQILDMLLDDMLRDPLSTAVWLGEPEIVDWEALVGYQFDFYPRTGSHPTLELTHLKAHLAAKNVPLCCDSLRKQYVHLVDANHKEIRAWTAYRCLYAEILDNGANYVLRNGNWMRVKPSFVDQVNNSLTGIEVRDVGLPEFQHDAEGIYNAFVAASDGNYYSMDANNIRLGGLYDKIEFCDLIKNGRTLIHVKVYRSSSTLSHLFSQGHVAAETFAKDEQFRTRLNAQLPPESRLADPLARPDTSQYSIIYAIATTKQLPHELPFFSKVTLKNAARTLRALHYDIALSRISISEDWIKTTKHRAH